MNYINGVSAFLFTLNVLTWSSSIQGRQGKPIVEGHHINQIERSGLSRRLTSNMSKYVPDFHIGPKKHKNYDPSLGYEVYWEEGVWVYTTKEPNTEHLCGERCTKIYTDYGYICGKDSDFRHRTFENYCEMRNIDCEDKFRWRIAYRGKCQGPMKVFPTQSRNIVARVPNWIKEFEDKHPRTG